MKVDRARLEVFPGVWLDHRRAAYLADESILAVADLHLGYAWAHRYRGQMLPVEPQDAVPERIEELRAEYAPRMIVVLGDIVHQAVPAVGVAEELARLADMLSPKCDLRLILGNHDRGLPGLLGKEVGKVAKPELQRSMRMGRYAFAHGDGEAGSVELSGADLLLMGHEHPAIGLGDGIAEAKCPCFLVSDRLLVLPAFSHWAAGSDIRVHGLMSAAARAESFTKAVVICGRKLLALPLGKAGGAG